MSDPAEPAATPAEPSGSVPFSPEEHLAEAIEVTIEWLLFHRDNGMDMIASAHTKGAEEAAELAANPSDITEWVDTFHCLIGVALQQSWDVATLAAAVSAKNAVNAARTWRQKPDGTWQHVKVS